MDLGLSDDDAALVATTRDYARRVLRPAAARLESLDRPDEFPFDLMREGTALGLKSLPLPSALGGRGADMVTQCLVATERAGAKDGVGGAGAQQLVASRAEGSRG